MLEVRRVRDDRLDIVLSGRLDSEGMRQALDELVEKSEGIEDGKMLYDVVDFQMPTLDAIVVELSRIPKMYGWIFRFKRAAVLCDRKWVQVISEVEGALIPGLDIKAFERIDRTAAEKWLEQG